MIKNILVAAAFSAAMVGANAAANLVQNGDLTGTTTTYVYNATPASVATFYGPVPTTPSTVTNWFGSFVSIAGNSQAWDFPGSQAHAAGNTSGYVAGLQADGTLWQTLDLQAGTYVLTWSEANRTGNAASQSYSVSFGTDTFQSYATNAANGWETESIKFTLGAETTADLIFKGLTSYQNTDATSFIDNVSLSAVPEPTSLLLMAVGTLGLLAWRRRAQV